MESNSLERDQPEELNEHAWRGVIIHLRRQRFGEQQRLGILVQIEGFAHDAVTIQKRMEYGNLEHPVEVFVEVTDDKSHFSGYGDEIEGQPERVDWHWTARSGQYSAASYDAWNDLSYQHSKWWMEELFDDARG